MSQLHQRISRAAAITCEAKAAARQNFPNWSEDSIESYALGAVSSRCARLETELQIARTEIDVLTLVLADYEEKRRRCHCI